MWKFLFMLVPAALMILGLLETLMYTRIKKVYHKLPVAAATITYSRLLNYIDLDGKREIGAIIKYKYTFRGKEYESETPVLKGYDLFPSLDYYQQLVKENRPGDIINVRVLPTFPELAYITVAPLSRLSTVLAPVVSLGSIALIVAYFLGLGTLIDELFLSVI
jgi:Protein of unknown function (DUF3592)